MAHAPLCWRAAGRYDLARTLEKWGGLVEVARLMGLEPWSGSHRPGLLQNLAAKKTSGGGAAPLVGGQAPGGGKRGAEQEPAPAAAAAVTAAAGACAAPDKNERGPRQRAREEGEQATEKGPMKATAPVRSKKWVRIGADRLSGLFLVGGGALHALGAQLSGALWHTSSFL